MLALPFFSYRYHLSFDDDSEVELNESCRPQFSDINKASGVLDKELEASGFTRKDQDDMEKVEPVGFPLPNIFKHVILHKFRKYSLFF